MKRRILFIVTSDPRSSGRPAEAVRIAAGVGTSELINVVLYLRGAAVLALAESAEELVDGDSFIQYLPIAAAGGRRVCAQRGSSLLAGLGDTWVKFDPVDDQELARLAADSDCILRF